MNDHAPSTVLLVEDDAPTRTFLADNLSADGYDVLVARSTREAVDLLETQFPDAVVLDVGLPDGSGLDVVRAVREADPRVSRIDPRTPVVVLSGRATELDRLRGFERGCDDYLSKPFSYPELRARVAALLRRVQDRPARGRTRVGPLDVDANTREARLDGDLLELSQKEFGLLRVLASEPGRVFTKAELARLVWGSRDGSMGASRTLDSHACRLRRKLADGGHRMVVNVWGVGYRLLDADVRELAA